MRYAALFLALAASTVSAQVANLTACTTTSVAPGVKTITGVVTSTYCPVCDDAKKTDGKYVTTYETVYASVCPTGIAQVTYLVSQTCTGTTEIDTATCPPGFVPETTVCDACPGSPTTVVTVPCSTCPVATSEGKVYVQAPPSTTGAVYTITVPAGGSSNVVCPGSPSCPSDIAPGTYTAGCTVTATASGTPGEEGPDKTATEGPDKTATEGPDKTPGGTAATAMPSSSIKPFLGAATQISSGVLSMAVGIISVFVGMLML